MQELEDFNKFVKKNKVVYKKKEFSKNRWQHEAVVYAEDLKVELSKNWFRFFKMYFGKHEHLFKSAREYMLYKQIFSDRYFYAVVYRRKNARS